MKKIFPGLFLLIVFNSCKKDTACYECTDPQGNDIGTVCGTDEQDAFNNSGIINGTHNIDNFRKYCKKK